jgi:YVTN family beta-propeller protein
MTCKLHISLIRKDLKVLVCWTFLAVFVLFYSCEPDDPVPGEIQGGFSTGVFVVNEGLFLAGNASLSFIDIQRDSVHNYIFRRVNQVPLGDVAHSMSVLKDQAFIVVNNSGKIYRTNARTMEFQGKVTGLTSPRYVTLNPDIIQAKAYVSDLYSGRIMVIDPVKDAILDSIDIRLSGNRRSTEQMILIHSMLYVACWSYSDQVLIIDTGTDRVIDSIRVGKQPNSMVVDKNGYIWVLSDGGYPFSPFGQEEASLSRIDPNDRMVRRMRTWENMAASPTDLCINPAGDSLYFIDGGVYKGSLDMKGFDEPLIPEHGRQLYSLGIDPFNGHIYLGDAVDYQQDGWVYRYRSGGMLIDSFRVGINPGHFCFYDQGNQ